ncbi:CPBP family intramembrane glutamic endopeptidase [Wolbachia endosymbiont of Ctenocephalides felis wCfeT]|uniref:CPBP family intramembrane glutamic endopeptidase n=1 Tax=Wolbachia endosymbiont of Ctenocephalides felis wCfeT TaxID=2732593 RepID=UPI00158210FC|nr:CPBP family intramembrane glutamic endopeptidase [Wolbachia endosymbiont of Ctenocephalides felis wCfeT]
MNSTIVNCTLFVAITYLLTCIIAWSLPTQYAALTTFIPALVAILLTACNKQRVSDLFKLSSLKNCSLGFVIMLAARVIALLLAILIFTFVATGEYVYTLEKVKYLNAVQIFFILLSTFIMLIITSLGEEIGWRGYLLKKLRSQIPNFYARAIIVGFIWAIWHIPLYIAPGSAESAMLWKDGFTFPIMCSYILVICTMSIMFTWLFEKDNSVWPVTIAHATNNFTVVAITLFTIGPPASTATIVIGYILAAVAQLTVAMGVICFDKTRERRLSSA